MKHVFTLGLLAIAALGAGAQETGLHTDAGSMMPAAVAAPRQAAGSLVGRPNASWTDYGQWSDSLQLGMDWTDMTPAPYDFKANPYGRDLSTSGSLGTGRWHLTGSSAFTSFPALGNLGSASVGLETTVGNRLTLSAGLTGMKYHMGRDAWNDYGFYATGSWRVSNQVSVNVFGQFYRRDRYHSMAGMAYMPASGYGLTSTVQFLNDFEVEMGFRRYHDPYSGTWRTAPVWPPPWWWAAKRWALMWVACSMTCCRSTTTDKPSPRAQQHRAADSPPCPVLPSKCLTFTASTNHTHSTKPPTRPQKHGVRVVYFAL